MARKVKEGKLDLYYLKNEEKKSRAKNNSPSKHKSNKKTTNKNDDDKFNFDNEIVIGLNILPDEKEKKSKKSKKNTDNTQNNKPKDKTKEKPNSNSKKVEKPKKNLKTNKEDKIKEKSQTQNKSKGKQNSRVKNNAPNKFNFDEEIVIGVNVPQNAKASKGKNNLKNKQNLKDKKIDLDKQETNYIKARRTVRSFVILFVFIIAAILFMGSPIFNISKINISGNSKISQEQIISFSKIQLGINTYKLINSQIENNIKENAYIDTVTVKRKLPNEINIVVTERKPQYMLKYGNAYVYLSSQGYMLEVNETKLDLPIISGYTTEEENLKAGNRLNKEDLTKLEVVLKIMESAINNGIYTDISEINIEDENNYTLVLEAKGKTAYLGDATSINDRMIVLKQMLIKAEGKTGEAFLVDKDKMYFREE